MKVMETKTVEEQEDTHEAMQWEAESQPVEVGKGNDILIVEHRHQLPDGRATLANDKDLLWC
jgi:hypothetical protein